jgi:8-oxo-dGTP pyrophosphatase MutT (NUDIX family)
MTDYQNFSYEQSGIIPYRKRGGQFEVLLITSRKKRRWIIPKGFIKRPLSSEASAIQEAFEEAGVLGRIQRPAAGFYSLKKWGTLCHVEVFLLQVHTVLDDWPESTERKRQWMVLREALKRVANPGLCDLLGELPARIAAFRP